MSKTDLMRQLVSELNVGMAMMRNRYVYAQSCGTVVVRSEYNKGGTWAGAIDNLKNEWCKELCRDKNKHLLAILKHFFYEIKRMV